MPRQISRRAFVKAGTAAVAAAAGRSLIHGPTLLPRRKVAPLVVASGNGHLHRNGGPRTCVEEVFLGITKGRDVLRSVLAGVTILERDPAELSVGYGGLPNAEGVVQLDASCMHGPRRKAGAVAALEGVRTPSLVAEAVMEKTDHLLLAGGDAQRFAKEAGFEVEADLNTDRSRELWRRWKRRSASAASPGGADRSMPARASGTVTCIGLGRKGEICGVTSTSGLAWKLPGRVGDSPIIGAGLYVDTDVGGTGATGLGETTLYNLSAFHIVELMRSGRHPKDAAIEALRRIRANTTDPRRLDANGLPDFQVVFYVLNRKGQHAGVALRERKDLAYSICTENGPERVPVVGVLPAG